MKAVSICESEIMDFVMSYELLVYIEANEDE